MCGEYLPKIRLKLEDSITYPLSTVTYKQLKKENVCKDALILFLERFGIDGKPSYQEVFSICPEAWLPDLMKKDFNLSRCWCKDNPVKILFQNDDSITAITHFKAIQPVRFCPQCGTKL